MTDTDPLAELPGRAWPFFCLAFVHDVARFLALVHQGQLDLNPQGQLQIGSVSRLARELALQPEAPPPLSEGQARALSFLFGLLLHAGLVGVVGDSLCLTAVAHDWLSLPAHRQIDQLRQVWWLNPVSTVRWLPSSRGQRSANSPRQQVILETAQWVADLPPDRWTPAAALDACLASRGVTARGVESNLPSVRRARKREASALGRFLLEVVLPGLGLTEVRERGEGLHLHPTPEGVAWLRAALARTCLLAHPPQATSVELSVPSNLLRLPSSPGPALTVEPDSPAEPDLLAISLCVDAPALCAFEIAHLAELLSPGPPARYRLTHHSLEQAVAWGYSATDALFLLDRFSCGQLPPSAAAQLRRWGEEMAVITCEPGYRLRTVAPAILTALRQRDPFRRRTVPLASNHRPGSGTPQDAWVGYAQAHDLFRYLRRIGYALHGTEQRGEREKERFPLLPPLPLSSLLVALRTYEQLRRLIPGLAVLELGDLEQALTNALLPDDLAGVERLVQSHLVFLRHHLKKDPQATDSEQEGPGSSTPPSRGNSAACDRQQPTCDLEARLQAAIDAGTTLDIAYADTQGQTTRRRVRPLHLETYRGRQYLLAYCELRQDERHFRLDRIVEVG